MDEIKTKSDLYEVLTKKAPIDKNEFNVKYNEFKQKSMDWSEMDVISKDDIETTTLGQLHSYYLKVIESTASRFSGVLLGIIGYKDFGAGKMYNEARKLYDEDKDKSINIGTEYKTSAGKTYYIKCDVDGKPLYPQGYGFKAGKPIDLDKDKSMELLLITKRTDGETPDDNMRKTLLTLNFDKFNITKPFYKKEIEFLANINSNSTTENMYVLTQASATEFIVKNNETVDINEIINEYFSENKVKLSELGSWHEQNANNFDRLAFIKGFSSSINLSAPFSNILNIADLNSGTSITCFVNKDIPMNFPENIPGVIVFGRTKTKKDDPSVIQISAYGVWCPDNFLINVEKPDESKIEEKTEFEKSFEGVELTEKPKKEEKGKIKEVPIIKKEKPKEKDEIDEEEYDEPVEVGESKSDESEDSGDDW